MDKTYSLTKLMEIDAFDVKKCTARVKSKDAFFALLTRFVIDSDTLIAKCDIDAFLEGEIPREDLLPVLSKLRGIVGGIGAIEFVWALQNAELLLEKRRNSDFAKELAKILTEIEDLRQKIIAAEKDTGGDETVFESTHEKGVHPERVPNTEKPKGRIRGESFELLYLLLDNFEPDGACAILTDLMKFTFEPEVDDILSNVMSLLEDFNYTAARDEAARLLELVETVYTPKLTARKIVLAIDDMPDVLRSVKSMLKDKFNVLCATEYDTALKILRSQTADVIILDIEMPGHDGFEVLRLFRSLPEYAETPIIFLTGNVNPDYIATAGKLGACDFIGKPVDKAMLTDKIEKALVQHLLIV